MHSINTLISWSKENFSDLPWRKNRSLYSTLVSEIMLQQTTVQTVLKKYEPFLKEYPTLEILSKAELEDVLLTWRGLGYYRRARNLKSAADEMLRFYGGEIPLEKENLLKIKGIGEYTSSAIRSIGAQKKDLAIDGNLERVLARLHAFSEPKGPKLQKKIKEEFFYGGLNFPKKINYRELNEALMDLGRMICRPRNPQCELCPLLKQCQAYKKNWVDKLPEKKNVSKISLTQLELLRVICLSNGKLAVYKKKKGEWLEGAWEVPTFVISCPEKTFVQYPRIKSIQKNKILKNPKQFKTSITRYEINNKILKVSPESLKRFFQISTPLLRN